MQWYRTIRNMRKFEFIRWMAQCSQWQCARERKELYSGQKLGKMNRMQFNVIEWNREKMKDKKFLNQQTVFYIASRIPVRHRTGARYVVVSDRTVNSKNTHLAQYIWFAGKYESFIYIMLRSSSSSSREKVVVQLLARWIEWKWNLWKHFDIHYTYMYGINIAALMQYACRL